MSWSSSFFRYSKASLFFVARFGSVISLGNALALLMDPVEQNDTMIALSFAMPCALLAVITSQYHSYHQKEVDAWYKHAIIATQATLMGLIREAGVYTAIRFLLTLPAEDNLWFTWVKFMLASGAGLAAFGISLYETHQPSNVNKSNPGLVNLQAQLKQHFDQLNQTISESKMEFSGEAREHLMIFYQQVLSDIQKEAEKENQSINSVEASYSLKYI